MNRPPGRTATRALTVVGVLVTGIALAFAVYGR